MWPWLALKSQSYLSLATSGFNKDESCSQLPWKRLWQNKCLRLGIIWSWESHPSHSQHYISWVPVNTCWRLSLTKAFLQGPSVTPKPKPASQSPPYLKTHNMSLSSKGPTYVSSKLISLLACCVHCGFFFYILPPQKNSGSSHLPPFSSLYAYNYMPIIICI